MTQETRKQTCTALRLDGQPCRAWAMPAMAGYAPRCAAHREQEALEVLQPLVASAPREGALYDDLMDDLEYAALSAVPRQSSLHGEVRMVRVSLRRLFAATASPDALDGTTLESHSLALFKGAVTVAQLLMNERLLQGDEEDEARGAIAQALAEISAELDLEPRTHRTA